MKFLQEIKVGGMETYGVSGDVGLIYIMCPFAFGSQINKFAPSV